MNLVWRLVRTYVKSHGKAFLARFIIAAAIAATPYAFSFLGKWLVDEALQVTGPPQPKPVAETKEAPALADPPVTLEWKAKTAEEKLQLLGVFLAASMGIHVAVTGLSALSELLNSKTVQQMAFELRTAVHEKLQRLEMGLFGREQVGQLMTRTLDDTGAIPGNLTNLVINSATQIAMLILGLILLLRLNPKMTLIALAALPFYAITCIIFLPRLRKNAEEIRERVAAFNGYVVERLSNVATIKNYAQEDRELAAFGDLLSRNQALARRQHRLSLFFNTATTLITSVSTLTVLAIGFLNIKAQRMQLGEVLAFYQVTAQLFVPISALVGMTTVAQTLQVLAERVYSILDTKETLDDAPDAVDLAEIHGNIEFEDVSLRYQEGGPFAVLNVTLSIPAGTTVCIVGPTGCGKSTLIALLTRLYDPTQGAIRVDGVDIRKLRVRRLRRAVGNILHDCQVFAGTFAENLRFGAPKATGEEIEAAARLVGLHDFIASQPDGYETRIGRQGLELGTQELAKLAVARALVTKPAILAIDDTFSAIDEEVETLLRHAITTELTDHTVLIATSRLSICQDAEMIVVMQKGRVAQVGTHEELLAVPGIYRRMYMRQMGIESVE